MAIPLSKAKEVCTSSEFALVSASRSPKLNKLSPEQSKSLAGRARKAVDKWEDLSRGQARAGSAGERTRLKADLFRDALDRFEAKVAAGPATSGGKRAGQAKRTRARGHRKTRAAAREKLAGATFAYDRRAELGGTGAVRRPKRARKVKVGKPAAAKARAKKQQPKLWAAAPSGRKFAVSPEKQRAARTRAKKARFAESGLTSRVRGQISASGKRNQARRDRKRSQAGR